MTMSKTIFKFALLAQASCANSESSTDWSGNSQHFQNFDTVRFAGLVGTDGQDPSVLHNGLNFPEVKMTSMEKSMTMTSLSVRKNIRSQLVSLLKQQVAIESIYTSRKEKLYISATAVYSFIGRLLHSACGIALQNDDLWKDQMQCFCAYKQLLEVYSMYNGVRDLGFALQHNMELTTESFSVCGGGQEMPQGDDIGAYRICLENLDTKTTALKNYLTNELVNSDGKSDRAESCLFRVVTVLTCLSANHHEMLLNLAITQEHKKTAVSSFARYAANALEQISEESNESSSEEDGPINFKSDDVERDNAMPSFFESDDSNMKILREVRPLQN